MEPKSNCPNCLNNPSGNITPEGLFEAIKHGDQAHQDWLREAIQSFWKGLPIPKQT